VIEPGPEQTPSLEAQLESCHKQRALVSGDPANTLVWDQTIDYILTRMMEQGLTSS
jgi:hypothetical protein